MPENEILAEIHRTRADIARECDYDVDKLFAYLRKKTAEYQASGWEVVSFEGQAPMELPPVDWEKIDAIPENEIIAEIRATRRAIAAERGSRQAKEPESLILREDPPKP